MNINAKRLSLPTAALLGAFVLTMEFGAVVSSSEPPSEVAKVIPQDVPIGELGTKFRLVGELGVPLGEMMTVQGVVIEGPYKGWEGGPNLRAQRINSVATQEVIRLPLRPYFGEFGEERQGLRLPALTTGESYELRGYESGCFVGHPFAAQEASGITLQTSDHGFLSYLVVVSGHRLDSLSFGPADFVDRRALLQGTARTQDGRALIVGNGWELSIEGAPPWPTDVEGRIVEALGTVRRAAADTGPFRMDNPETRLVRLADQVGKDVMLRATAWSMNGEWWISYRGDTVQVEHMAELIHKRDLHARAVVARGRLELRSPPRVEQIGMKEGRDTVDCYVVVGASIEPVDALLSPEVPIPR